MARLLPPESSAPDIVSREVGVSVQTLERWRAQALAEAVAEQPVFGQPALDGGGIARGCDYHGCAMDEAACGRKEPKTATATADFTVE